MVTGAKHDARDEGCRWRVVVGRIAMAAVIAGVFLGLLTRDWRIGLCAGAIIIGIPVVCLAVNILYAVMIIPITMLTMRVVGGRTQMGAESGRSQENTPQPEQSSGG